MNYRTVKNSKSNLLHYHLVKNIAHNKSSNLSLNFTDSVVKLFKNFFNSIFTPTQYTYDQFSDTCKPYNDNCYFRDITDLELRSSRRPF